MIPLGHLCQAVGNILGLATGWQRPFLTVPHRMSNFPLLSLQRWKNVELISRIACF